MASNADVLKIALPQLKTYEGCELSAYPDPLSPLGRALEVRGIRLADYEQFAGWRGLSGTPWTLGYGDANGHFPGDTCTQDAADAWLAGRCFKFMAQMDSFMPWWRKLDAVRGAALLCMVYQLGPGLEARFPHAMAALERSDYQAAVDGFLWADKPGGRPSLWAQQTRARAVAETQQLLTGVIA